MNIIGKLKSNKKLISIILTVAILISCFFIYSAFFAKNVIVKIETSYAFNVSDYRELAVFYKYIFVGQVDKITGTDYGSKDLPTTNYKVTPILNIKGNLKLNESLPYQKQGGISRTRAYTILMSGDVLPEVGKFYIFCTNASDNGEVFSSSGANSTIALEKIITEKTIEESKIVKKMVSACENPKYQNSFNITENTDRSVYDQKSKPSFLIEELTQNINLLKTMALSKNELLNRLDDFMLAELAGNYSYFFVGKIKEEGKLKIEEKHSPYIEYTVTPLCSVIDGTLQNYTSQQFVADVEIPFIKYGGFEIYDNTVEVTRADLIPEPGKLYMFTCVSTSDGTELYFYSPYAIIPLEDNLTEVNIKDSDLVAKYINARKNPAEVTAPIKNETGKISETRYTLQNYFNYMYYEEIRNAEKEGREPDLTLLEAYRYEIPDWLENNEQEELN